MRRSAETLRFRNTILVYLHVRQTGLFPDNWLSMGLLAASVAAGAGRASDLWTA